jgi:hypothetical protein
MQFFKPSDIVTIEGSVTNITRAGFAFAVDNKEDSIFIPVRLVENEKLEEGDFLTCYCVDQTLDENRRDDPMAARYRAIRIRVQTRMSDMFGGDTPVPVYPVPQPIKAFTPAPEPVAPPKPVMTPEVLKEKLFAAMKEDNRAWSSRDLADHVAFKFKADYQLPDEIAQKVSAMMFAEHHAGRVAACAIRRERDQVQPSALYYALTTDTLIDLLENYEVDGE